MERFPYTGHSCLSVLCITFQYKRLFSFLPPFLAAISSSWKLQPLFSVCNPSFLFFCSHSLSLLPFRKKRLLDMKLTVILYQLLFELLSPPPQQRLVSVSTASRAQPCVPLTWSSWLPCSTGGLRSRNHPSLFGRLYQMKSSQSRGAKMQNARLETFYG